MSDGSSRPATPSQTIGPFFHVALGPVRTRVTSQADVSGERVRMVVRVTDGDGRPVSDALLEVRQGGAFGRLLSTEDGTCEFDAIRPPSRAGVAAEFISLCVFARGLLRHLHTRIYFAGDPGLQEDPALALVPAARRQTLLATPADGPSGTWTFDLRLQGENETVFFDV